MMERAETLQMGLLGAGGQTEVYIHIPKTAGTFIRNALAAKYGDIGLAYGTPPHKLIAQQTTEELRQLKSKPAVAGHEDFHTFYSVFGGDASYSTLLRNPVDRLISYYNHAMANFPVFAARPVTLLRFLEQENNYEIDNLQLRYLSGKPKAEPVGQADLKNAKEMIKSGRIEIGVLEEMNEAVSYMPVFSGFNSVASAQKINVTNGGISRHTISGVELDRLRSMSRLDLNLYRFCRDEVIGRRRAEPG